MKNNLRKVLTFVYFPLIKNKYLISDVKIVFYFYSNVVIQIPIQEFEILPFILLMIKLISSNQCAIKQ